MARYGQAFKTRVVGRLLPPNTASIEEVSREVGVSVDTLERWSAPARLDAVITTAAMDDAAQSAWCRERGVYPQELAAWRASATQALAEPEEQRASPKETASDRRRMKQLERELRRKDKALAETAALLVLSKKLEAIFQRGEDE